MWNWVRTSTPAIEGGTKLNPQEFFYLLFLTFYVLIFRQWGREGEKEGERHQRVVASHMYPTGDLAHNPGMCPDWELNQ